MKIIIQIIALVLIGSILNSADITPFGNNFKTFWGIITLMSVACYSSYARGLEKAEDYIDEYEDL